MNNELPETKAQRRCSIIRKGCKFCSNDKLHTNGKREWCTKCKRDQ